MSRVFLNEIEIGKSVNYAELNRLYDFYLIENHGEYYKKTARVFDNPLISSNVLAVQYTSGPCFILMLKKDRMNEATISKIINDAQKEGYDLTKKKLSVPFENFQHSLVQILFNALAKSTKKEVSNLGGKLYCFSEKTRKQIFCVELKISKGYRLHLEGKTFTEVLDRKEREKPLYSLQLNNMLARCSNSNSEQKCYQEGQYKGTRHQISFLDVANVSKFEKTKVGILSKMLHKFEKQYGDCLPIQMKEENDWEKLEVKAAVSQKTTHLRRIKRILQNKKILIVDMVKTVESEDFCQKLKKSIERIFTNALYFLKDDRSLNFEVIFAENPEKDCLNLRVIHSEEFIENNNLEDLYEKFTDRAVQHVTLEDFPRCARSKQNDLVQKGDPEEAACIVALNDLLVKYDLIANPEKTLSLIDWTSYGYQSDWKFCWCVEDKDQKDLNHYYSMLIQPDGHFQVKEVLPKDQKEFSLYESIFEMNNFKAKVHNRSDEKYEGLVIRDDGEINIIQKTPMFMLPSVGEVEQELKEKKINRKKESIERLYAGCMDIYYKKSDAEACEYYSVGQIGRGMQSSVERSSVIRKVIPYQESKLFFREVLDTMNVTFVRHSQLTVMPFPFKYLREYKDLKN